MKENVFTGCTIVATGKLQHFTRNEIHAKILELGAKPGSSVTKKPTILSVVKMLEASWKKLRLSASRYYLKMIF